MHSASKNGPLKEQFGMLRTWELDQTGLFVSKGYFGERERLLLVSVSNKPLSNLAAIIKESAKMGEPLPACIK